MASGLIRACLFVSLVVLVCFVAEDQALKMSLRKATTFKKYTLAEKSRALKHIAQKTFNTLMSRHKGHKKATKQSDASEGSDGCQIAAFEECFATTADMPEISGDMSLEDQSTFCSAAGLLDLCVSQQLNNAASCNEESEEHQIFEDGLSAVAFLAYVCGNDTLSVIVDNFDCVETVLSDETCFGVIDEGERSKSRKRQGDDSDTPEESADDCTLLQQFLECFANDAATTCGENAQLETIIEDLVKIFAAPYLGSVPDACNIDSDIIVRAAKIQRAQHKVDQKKSQLLDLLERLGQNKKSPFRTGFID